MFRINIKLCDIFKINLILMPIIIPLVIVGLVLGGVSYNLGLGLALMGNGESWLLFGNLMLVIIRNSR